MWCKFGRVPRGFPRGRTPRTPQSGGKDCSKQFCQVCPLLLLYYSRASRWVIRRSIRLALSTRWSMTLSSKVTLPHAIDFRALCGENMVTCPGDFCGVEPKQFQAVLPGLSSFPSLLLSSRALSGTKVYEPCSIHTVKYDPFIRSQLFRV